MQAARSDRAPIMFADRFQDGQAYGGVVHEEKQETEGGTVYSER